MIKPILDKVAVKAEEVKTQTEGGIMLPGDIDENKPRKGEVLAVGPGKVNEITGEIDPPQVAVGDVVVFGRTAGSEVDTDEGKVLIMIESEILAVIK